MRNPHALILKALFTSTVPLILLGGFQLFQLLSGDSDTIFWIKDLSQKISHFYNNYFGFVVMMIISNAIIAFIKTIYQYVQTQHQPGQPNLQKTNQSVLHFCKLIVCYTFIFICHQMILSGSSFLNHHIPLFNSQQLNPYETQFLLQNSHSASQDIDELLENLIGVPTLSPGEVLGVYSHPTDRAPQARGLAMSKDGNTLFVINNGKLSVVNISNPNQEEEISTTRIPILLELSWEVTLLSPDEMLLYIFSGTHLLIIDISNRKSPSLIFKSEHTTKERRSNYSSIVLSSDGKTLYSQTERDLRIYNVSSPKSPLLLYNKSYNFCGGLALSKDNSKLAVGSLTKLEILNTTDPSNPVQISSTDLLYNLIGIFSLTFSNDESQIFIGLMKPKVLYGPLYFAILDIRKLSASSQPGLRLLTNEGGLCPSFYFHENKEFAFYHTRKTFRMFRVADGNYINVYSLKPDLSSRPFAASAENKRNAVYLDDDITLMRFHIDLVAQSFVYFKPNALPVIQDNILTGIALNTQENKVFFAQSIDKDLQLLPYERSSNLSWQGLNPVPFLYGQVSESSIQETPKMNIIARKNLVVVALGDYFQDSTSRPNTFIFNITNKTNPTFFSGLSHSFAACAVTLTQDEKSLVFLQPPNDKSKNFALNIMTFDNEKFLPSLINFNLSGQRCKFETPLIKVSQDGSLLFSLNCDLIIYNISDPKQPTLVSTYDLGIKRTYAFTLSEDENILYLFGFSLNEEDELLQIIDISNYKSPQLLNSTCIDHDSESSETIQLSADEKVLYLGFQDGMLMIDVRLPTKPVLFGFQHFLDEMHALTFANHANLFYTATTSEVTAFDITSNHILHIEDSDFKIGGSYPIVLNVLKMNKNLKFDFMMENHKFLKVSFFNFEKFSSTGTPYALLPSWITFDKEKSVLIFEPSSPTNVGSYNISVALSLQIQSSTFIGLNSISNESQAKNLMLSLIHSGYINNLGYISDNIDLTQELWLDSQYEKLEKDIRAILSKNYIEAIGEISVSSSLSLQLAKPLAVFTKSTGIISVAIQLNRTDRNPYFLGKTYSNLKSSITNERSLLLLDGSLNEVNEALREVLIDLDQLPYCNGTITVTDGINPPIFQFINSISNYLTVNDEEIYIGKDNFLAIRSINPDHLNVKIQLDSKTSQEYQAHFATKTYSSVKTALTAQNTVLHLEGFMEDINDALKEILVDLGKLKSSGGTITVIDDTNPPKSKRFEALSDFFLHNQEPQYNSTISLQTQIDEQPLYTGSYSGIELNPDTFTDQNNLTLEYSIETEDPKQEMPSWIHLKSLRITGTPPEKFPPVSYKLKLVVKNEFRSISVPFTLKINISFSYAVRLGVSFLGSIVSLIGFIVTANKIYNILAKKYYRYPRSFRLKAGEEITDDKVFPISLIKTEIKHSNNLFKQLKRYIQQDLIENFMDPQSQILDKQKIVTTLAILGNQYYNEAETFSREFIQQLVINRIVMEQLKSKQETVTRDIFNKIKSQWMDLITVTSSLSSSPQFIIKSKTLEQKLSKAHSEGGLNETTLTSERLLSNKNGLNMDLLENAVKAHAFDFLNLDVDAMSIDVISYKKIKGSSIRHLLARFFQRDLKRFVLLNKREIGYGIDYSIEDSTLRFSGRLTRDLKDHVIVVHLKNSRGRILRELWITGETKESQDQSYMELVSETL